MPVEATSDGSAGAPARQPGAGELLHKERKQLGLSVEQVADNLHLDERVIEALEQEQYEEIGAPVFVRGHLRSYARVLRMDEQRVLDAYQAALPEEPTEPELSRRAPERRIAISPGPWAMGAFATVLIIALAVYVLWPEPEPAPASRAAPPPPAAVELVPPSEPAAPAPAPRATILPPAEDASPAAAAAAGSPAGPGPATPAPEAEPVSVTPPPEPEPEPVSITPPPEPEATAEVEAEAVAPATTLRLELYFRAESWVEISDAERRILFGLQREGMRRQLAGEPPLQLLIGNAPGVDLYVDGEPYAIPRGRGKVARFTIDPAAGTGP